MKGRKLFGNSKTLAEQAKERHTKLVDQFVLPEKITTEIRWLQKAYKEIIKDDKNMYAKRQAEAALPAGLNNVYALLGYYVDFNRLPDGVVQKLNQDRADLPAVIHMTDYDQFQRETKAFRDRAVQYLLTLRNEMINSRIEVKDGQVLRTRFFDHQPPRVALKIHHLVGTANLSNKSDEEIFALFDKVREIFHHAKRDSFDNEAVFEKYKSDNLEILAAFHFTPATNSPQHRLA